MILGMWSICPMATKGNLSEKQTRMSHSHCRFSCTWFSPYSSYSLTKPSWRSDRGSSQHMIHRWIWVLECHLLGQRVECRASLYTFQDYKCRFLYHCQCICLALGMTVSVFYNHRHMFWCTRSTHSMESNLAWEELLDRIHMSGRKNVSSWTMSKGPLSDRNQQCKKPGTGPFGRRMTD